MNYKEEADKDPDQLKNGVWLLRLFDGSVKARIRFDPIEGTNFLQEYGFHNLRIEELGTKEKIKYVHINGENVEEVDKDYVKHFIISFLIYNGSEALRNYLVENDIFIAPNLLDCLRERIPYEVYEDKMLTFHVEEGLISVKKDRIQMEYVKVKE